jgi:antibiotic biosynthesis monooxygenase (ABM) superfamily enzyme
VKHLPIHFLLNWIGAFVTITTLLYAMQPMMVEWPIWLRALTLSGLMVLLMQTFVMPSIAKLTQKIGLTK